MKRNVAQTNLAAEPSAPKAARTKRTASFRHPLPAFAASRLLLICALTCSLAFAAPASAFAETTDIDAAPSELQQQIESTAKAYDEATARVADIERQIADNQAKILQLESDLPNQQERGASAMRALYKLQQESSGLINAILDAESLGDFLVVFEYIDHIQQRNVSEIERLQSMQDELNTTQAQLAEAKKSAETEQANAQAALGAAQAAREEAQRKAQEQAAQEAKAQEQAAAQQAEQKAAETQKQAENPVKEDEAKQEQAAEEDAADTPEPSVPDEVTPPSDDVDWDADKAAFVSEWSARLDAYLAGSPLSGQGKTFAEAAWNYGVDPRWSPAISNTESTKGAYCFNPYNAWGWGNVSWGSWEEAINAHVCGLANGYGYTISIAAAKKYNPSNWQHWYDVTLAQMNII